MKSFASLKEAANLSDDQQDYEDSPGIRTNSLGFNSDTSDEFDQEEEDEEPDDGNPRPR